MHTLYIVLNCLATLGAIVFIVIGILMVFYCTFAIKEIKDDIEVLKYDIKHIGELIEERTVDKLSLEIQNTPVVDTDYLYEDNECPSENITVPEFDMVTHVL